MTECLYKVHVVIDAQNDFITGALLNPDAQKALPKIVEHLKDLDKDFECVVFTQDTHYDDYLETYEGKKLPVPHCIKGTEGWEIANELKEFILKDENDENCNTIEKETFGTFDLDEFDLGPVEFHIYGFCTDICVISNALILRAQYPDCDIFIHADCCAGTTPENHKAALAVAKSCQIAVVGEDESN